MQWSSNESTQKERDRERLAADLAEFLSRGGHIEQVELLRRPVTGGLPTGPSGRAAVKDEVDLADPDD